MLRENNPSKNTTILENIRADNYLLHSVLGLKPIFHALRNSEWVQSILGFCQIGKPQLSRWHCATGSPLRGMDGRERQTVRLSHALVMRVCVCVCVHVYMCVCVHQMNECLSVHKRICYVTRTTRHCVLGTVRCGARMQGLTPCRRLTSAEHPSQHGISVGGQCCPVGVMHVCVRYRKKAHVCLGRIWC